MGDFRIYHNPRCRKSREALAALEDKGVNLEVVFYLDEGLDSNEIRDLAELLGMNLIDFVRKGESAFKELELSRDSDEEELIEALLEKPILLQRPIVVKNDAVAVIGRPLENVLELL